MEEHIVCERCRPPWPQPPPPLRPFINNVSFRYKSFAIKFKRPTAWKSSAPPPPAQAKPIPPPRSKPAPCIAPWKLPKTSNAPPQTMASQVDEVEQATVRIGESLSEMQHQVAKPYFPPRYYEDATPKKMAQARPKEKLISRKNKDSTKEERAEFRQGLYEDLHMHAHT